MAEEKRFAVLIDSDNVSAKYIKYILDEVSNNGSITYKRIYGDWTSDNAGAWKKVLLDYSITPIQQYSYTYGKNATDSAMIIDAMDILYSGQVEGFCIVSSDSDFTKLAARLRESGKIVIGMGEKKTPKPFCAACNIFKYLEILMNEDTVEEEEPVAAAKQSHSKKKPVEVENTMTDIKTIEDALINIIIENGDDENGGIDMGELGSRLQKRYPDFDTRNYGYSKLSKFLTKFETISMQPTGSSITVMLKAPEEDHSMEKTLTELIRAHGERGVNMGTLSQEIRRAYPNFNVKEYGYSKFEQFVRSFECFEIKNVTPLNKRVTLKKEL